MGANGVGGGGTPMARYEYNGCAGRAVVRWLYKGITLKIAIGRRS
jgi:hypothetical protein